MNVLLLRLEAPLMAFGGPIVDNYGVIQSFPAISMLTGLLGNALGWEHREAAALNRLQSRIRFAARLDRPGERIIDYQTVDLGQDFMVDTGWTTWGQREVRGGASSTGTHIRYRHYRADACATVALALDSEEADLTVATLEQALITPARPLFIGRKTCLPALPILQGKIKTPSVIEALRTLPAIYAKRVQAQWPADEEGPSLSRLVVLTDERDWINQVHSGERLVRQGELLLENHDALHDANVS